MAEFKKGQEVEWHYGRGTAEGKIAQVFTEKVTRTIKGSKITRNADRQYPAYLVEQEDGGKALKSESELSKS